MSRTISLTKINAASQCDVSCVCSPSSISVFQRIKQAGYDRILCLAVQAVSVEGRCKTLRRQRVSWFNSPVLSSWKKNCSELWPDHYQIRPPWWSNVYVLIALPYDAIVENLCMQIQRLLSSISHKYRKSCFSLIDVLACYQFSLHNFREEYVSWRHLWYSYPVQDVAWVAHSNFQRQGNYMQNQLGIQNIWVDALRFISLHLLLIDTYLFFSAGCRVSGRV